MGWLTRIASFLSGIPRWFLKHKGGAVPDDDTADTLKRRNDVEKWARGGGSEDKKKK